MSNFISMIVCILVAANALASDSSSSEKVAQAHQEFAKRTPFANDEAGVVTAVKLITEAVAEAESAEAKYVALVQSVRIFVWHGMHVADESKVLGIFEAAMNAADSARKLPGFESKAEAQYFYSVALGRWALKKGKMTVLDRRKEMFESLDKSLNGETIDGELGLEYEFYGSDRVYSRLLIELPALFGGDKKRSLVHSQKAYSAAPEYVLNGVYYANSLEENNKKAEACAVIVNVLKQDPRAIADRWQDAVEDLTDAQKFHDEKCK